MVRISSVDPSCCIISQERETRGRFSFWPFFREITAATAGQRLQTLSKVSFRVATISSSEMKNEYGSFSSYNIHTKNRQTNDHPTSTEQPQNSQKQIQRDTEGHRGTQRDTIRVSESNQSKQ